MKSVTRTIKRVASWMNVFAGIVVFIMMIATVTDIILRFFGSPIMGSYEMVSMMGAIVIGYALPKTTLERAHIFIDLLVNRAPQSARQKLFICTRILGIALFSALAWFLFLKGYGVYKAEEVSQVLQISHYPVAYALVFCCIAQCFVLIADVGEGLGRGEGK